MELPIEQPIGLPIELPIAYCLLPIELPIVLPIAYWLKVAPIAHWPKSGLAWGAKGPGPDRLGLLHFQKVQYLIVFNLKSQSHIQIMTAFLQCF